MKDLGPLSTVVCRLSVGEAKLSDTGSWLCELSNAAGKTTSACCVKVVDTVSQTNETPPSFEQLLSNITVTEFADAVLKCKAVGKPQPEVKWFRNDVPIDPSFRHEIKLDPSGCQTLTISNVGPSDEGIYKIRVTNTAGWASCDAKLYISGKPEDVTPNTGRKSSEYSLVDTVKGRKAEQNLLNDTDALLNVMCDSAAIKKFLIKWKLEDKALGFPVHLRNKCSVEGSQAVLGCLVNGIPPYTVRWYKGNQEIFDGPKYFIRGNLNILSLEIPIVELDDTGHYMCVVRNDQGKIFTSCYLQVEPRLEHLSAELPVKPFFTKPMKRQTVNEGDLVVFRVAAKANPSPGFKWFKDGQELHENVRINIETLPHGVAQLIIHMATRRDIGLYVCEAHNHAGRARSMVRLSVRDEYEARQEASKKPIEDITVRTEGTSESSGQQNGLIKHTAPQYEPRVESETFPRAPVLNSALPKTKVIRDRGRFILECSVSGFPKPKVIWMKNDQTLQEDDHLHFLSLGDWCGLEILDALPRDEGIYTVKLENSAGSVTSSCRIEMKLPKEDLKFFHTKEEELEGFFHKPVLHLIESEFPWHQFDIPAITPSFHLCNYEADRSEHISRESVCLVDTLETPQISKPLPDTVTPFEQDTDLRLSCEIGGKPCPHVVWFKDDSQLHESDDLSIKWDPETRLAALIFKSVKLQDSGKYSCIAFSDAGHAVTFTVIQVRGLDYPDKEKESTKRVIPEFKVRLTDREAVPGQEVRLEVKAEGFPPPEVRWFKNTEPITAEIEKYSITSSVEGVHALVIPDIHISDSDCFKCEAKNDYGAVSTCAHVKVLEHSDVESNDTVRPYFEEPLHSISVLPGQDAVFKCIAKGNPMPAFKWLKQGMTNIDQNRVKVEVTDGETSLTLKKVTQHDAGLYYCFANNRVGTVKSCASLTVMGSDNISKSQNITKPVEKATKKDQTLFEEDAYKETLAQDVESSATTSMADKTADKPEDDTSMETDSVNVVTTEPEKDIQDSGNSDKTVEQSETVDDGQNNSEIQESGKKDDSDMIDNQQIAKDDQVQETKQSSEKGKCMEKSDESAAQPDNSEDSNKNKTSDETKSKDETEKTDDNTVPKDPEPTKQKSDTKNEKSISEEKHEVTSDKELDQSSLQTENESTIAESLDQIKDEIIENLHGESDSTSEKHESKNKSKSGDNINDSIQSRTSKLPRFISYPRSQWVALNSHLEFVFTAEKCEDLTVAWYKDEKILKDDRFQMIWD